MNVAHLLERAAIRFPDQLFWKDSGRVITYRDGAERVRKLANGLLGHFGTATRIAILTENRFEGLEAMVSIMAAGMTAVPLNPRLHPLEHVSILENSQATAIVHTDSYATHMSEIADRMPALRTIRIGPAGDDESDYERLVRQGGSHPPILAIEPTDTAWLFYTSGTTGKPKGVMQTHRVLLNMVQQYHIAVIPDAGPDDVFLHAAPICHASGSSFLPHMALGASNVFCAEGSFDPERIFEIIESERVTSSFLAPTMINRLAGHEPRRAYDLSSLKNIIYGGAAMHEAVLRRAIDRFGFCFVQIYGQAEAPVTISTLSKAEHVSAIGGTAPHRLRSVGRATSSVELRIVDDNDKPLLAGETGEICVRGDLVMPGYWNNETASHETLKGGWLHTGDAGHVDADDYLYITDRKKDMIISGGSNIYPREVEDAIAGHPDVSEVAVIGVPDEEWGESVKAFVVLRPGASLEVRDVIDFCRDRIASYKKPRHVAFVEELPKNATGKILKKTLRESPDG